MIDFVFFTVWQKKRYSKNQSCFIQAVISSNYVEINQQKVFRTAMFWRNPKLCEAVPSNWRKPRSKFDVTDAKIKLEFPEDMESLKDKRQNEILMGNREVNYPDILPQEQSSKHLSLSCNSRVQIDVNVYNNTTRNDINSWKVIQASSAHLTNIFMMVKHPVINILMVPQSKIQKRHY